MQTDTKPKRKNIRTAEEYVLVSYHTGLHSWYCHGCKQHIGSKAKLIKHGKSHPCMIDMNTGWEVE